MWTGIFLGLWSPGLNKFLGSSHRQKVGRLGGLICGLMPPAKVGRMGGLSCYFSRGLILWPPPGDQAMSAYPLSITPKIVDFCYAQMIIWAQEIVLSCLFVGGVEGSGLASGPIFSFLQWFFLGLLRRSLVCSDGQQPGAAHALLTTPKTFLFVLFLLLVMMAGIA